MSDPVVIVPRVMRNVADCGHVCLEMLTGIPYSRILGASPRRPRSDECGMTTRQLLNLAKRIGKPLRFVAGHPDEDVVGILDLAHVREDELGHFALYAKGTVYNPAQGEWWMDVDAYLADAKKRVAGYLVRA